MKLLEQKEVKIVNRGPKAGPSFQPAGSPEVDEMNWYKGNTTWKFLFGEYSPGDCSWEVALMGMTARNLHVWVTVINVCKCVRGASTQLWSFLSFISEMTTFLTRKKKMKRKK